MGRHATSNTDQLSPAAAERAALCTLMLDLGESAPTLCAGWDTSELAAHLLVRETRPDALLGLVIPPLHGYTAKVEKAAHDSKSYRDLVSRLQNGPPVWSPVGLPVVRDRANLHEYFIHHEDVRRAQPGWKARSLSVEESVGLWNLVRLMAPMLLRGIKKTRVTLKTPDGAERGIGREDAKHQVTITGEPGELLLYASGRRQVAEVRITGSQAGQAQLAAAPLGM